jgi:hypothetical protein
VRPSPLGTDCPFWCALARPGTKPVPVEVHPQYPPIPSSGVRRPPFGTLPAGGGRRRVLRRLTVRCGADVVQRVTHGRSNAAHSLSVLLPGAEVGGPAAAGEVPAEWLGGTTRPLGDQAEGTQGGAVASARAAREKAGGLRSEASRLPTSLPVEGPLLGAMPSKVRIFAATAKGRVKVSEFRPGRV